MDLQSCNKNGKKMVAIVHNIYIVTRNYSDDSVER
jgi:hypothetical protein